GWEPEHRPENRGRNSGCWPSRATGRSSRRTRGGCRLPDDGAVRQREKGTPQRAPASQRPASSFAEGRRGAQDFNRASNEFVSFIILSFQGGSQFFQAVTVPPGHGV